MQVAQGDYLSDTTEIIFRVLAWSTYTEEVEERVNRPLLTRPPLESERFVMGVVVERSHEPGR